MGITTSPGRVLSLRTELNGSAISVSLRWTTEPEQQEAVLNFFRNVGQFARPHDPLINVSQKEEHRRLVGHVYPHDNRTLRLA
jgi:hypothetical protein